MIVYWSDTLLYILYRQYRVGKYFLYSGVIFTESYKDPMDNTSLKPYIEKQTSISVNREK